MSDTITVNLSTFVTSLSVNVTTTAEEQTVSLVETTLDFLGGSPIGHKHVIADITDYNGGSNSSYLTLTGGTITGNLVVTGSLSAANYLGIPSPDLSKYLPLSGGKVTGNLTVAGSLSASSYLGIPSQDLSGYMALSGGKVTGNLTVTGSLSASSYLGIPSPDLSKYQLLSSVTPLSSGGTGATTVSAARTNLDVVQKSAGDETIGGNKTFSGQCEFTNQSAISATSVMTRSLTDYRVAAWRIWDLGYTERHGQTGNGTFDQVGVNVTNGTYVLDSNPGGGFVYVQWSGSGNPCTPFIKPGRPANIVNFADKVRCVVEFQITAGCLTGDGVARFWSTEAYNYTGTGEPTKIGFGFKQTTAGLIAQVRGAGGLYSSSPVTCPIAVVHRVDMLMLGGTLYWWLDGVAQANVDNGPTGVTGDYESMPFFSVYGSAAGRVNAMLIGVKSLVE